MGETDLDGLEPFSASPRAEMVQAARKFMSAPKVRQTSFEEQKRFLLGKGVTETEIDEARRTLPPPMAESAAVDYVGASPNMREYGQVRERSGRICSMQFANTMIVMGGIFYMSYRFLRSFILPRFFNVPDPETTEQRQLQQQMSELQNSMKFVMDSVVQTLRTVNQQQEQLNALLLMKSSEGSAGDGLQRLQSDISIVKSLLLNQNQFPAIPANIVARSSSQSVPAWQKAKNITPCSPTLPNGYQTPSADVDIPAEDMMNDREVEQTMSSGSRDSSA
ncbi:Peroxisomal membrane protein PEX14 [Toxocara canis]|uniref:Peroxisomal membrane protein PEX14 n=1 Tax=Toxocara canis TaxID=6265 RepID=A0A0B2VND2_TOXCA|nr:Peroxisomal membrane protein PEX14 [Toxocara canis]